MLSADLDERPCAPHHARGVGAAVRRHERAAGSLPAGVGGPLQLRLAEQAVRVGLDLPHVEHVVLVQRAWRPRQMQRQPTCAKRARQARVRGPSASLQVQPQERKHMLSSPSRRAGSAIAPRSAWSDDHTTCQRGVLSVGAQPITATTGGYNEAGTTHRGQALDGLASGVTKQCDGGVASDQLTRTVGGHVVQPKLGGVATHVLLLGPIVANIVGGGIGAGVVVGIVFVTLRQRTGGVSPSVAGGERHRGRLPCGAHLLNLFVCLLGRRTVGVKQQLERQSRVATVG